MHLRGTGAQQQGQIVYLLNRETAADDSAAAQNRLAYDRGADDLAIEDNGQIAARIFLRHIAELASAQGIETEGDDRMVVLKARLRIDKTLTADPYTPFHEELLPVILVRRQDHRSRGRGPRHLAGGGALVQKMERHLRRLADNVDQGARIVESGDLNKDTILTLPLNDRLTGSHFIDPSADDLYRLFDSMGPGGGQGRFVEGNGEPAVFETRDPKRIVDFPQLALSQVGLGLIPQAELHRAPVHAKTGVTDPFRPKHSPDRVNG